MILGNVILLPYLMTSIPLEKTSTRVASDPIW